MDSPANTRGVDGEMDAFLHCKKVGRLGSLWTIYLDPPTVPNFSLLAGFIDGKAQI